MIENLFLNVGATKAGTTWLYDQLCNHPEITFALEKEIHYFSAVAGKWNLLSHEARVQKFFRSIETKNIESVRTSINSITWYANYASPEVINNAWYQNLFKDAKGKYCADFCNLNCNLDDSGWRRVRQNFSNQLKVTYCMRDPYKRAWSHYKFHKEWIGQGHEILSNGFEGFKNFLAEDWFKEIVRYDLAIERLESNLASDEFMLFYFEDFRSQPQSTLDRVCDFLEIKKISKNESDFGSMVNASLDIKMPDEWSDYLWDYLTPVYAALSKKNLVHVDWLRHP